MTFSPRTSQGSVEGGARNRSLWLLILFSILAVAIGRASTNDILLTTLNCYWFKQWW